ncbi:hypothetical protein PHISP_01325 [Aspergillus sp. HF37]|nr:hypothetical protein PHISP_01325 [Aspergillus sp. HF37]
MDSYPLHYVALNRPLLLLSGLDSDPPAHHHHHDPLLDNGFHIDSDFPPLHGGLAEELRNVFLQEDADSSTIRGSEAGLKIKTAGRSYTLPRRKADPPTVSRSSSPADEQPPSSFVLHSPLSPLTPSSPTFPDGLLSPLWVTKHQSLVPAAVFNFFPLSLDPNMSSLRDNQLKIEINGLKKQWAASGFKSRLVVVLLSEEGESRYLADVDDRVAGIRRATNLDQRSVFVLPPDATPAELKEFTGSLLSLLQPSIMEYYRDLSKHARRKRSRSSIPPPTLPPTSGTSQTLSHHGWNVRYEFKLGVFAEFRQEMDAACRNYQSAYDTLFGQEVFENIPGWNPRFNDARLLADALAIRIIRCLLWAGQASVAVRSWVHHRTRTQDIVDRRGKGTGNYGWEAWESRWSIVMAELIRWAQIPSLFEDTAHLQAGGQYPIFVSPDSAAPAAGGLYPWEQLHHEGYWLYRSARHSMTRRTLAQQIPEEDRVPPGQSPASQIASKSYLYDTYLVPEPHLEAPQGGSSGFDHSDLILSTLKTSLEEFSKRNQMRKVESLSLEIADEYLRIGSWHEAHSILRPLWSNLSWRRSGWWQLMARFGWALRECALRVQDAESIIQIDWELLSKGADPISFSLCFAL